MQPPGLCLWVCTHSEKKLNFNLKKKHSVSNLNKITRILWFVEPRPSMVVTGHFKQRILNLQPQPTEKTRPGVCEHSMSKCFGHRHTSCCCTWGLAPGPVADWWLRKWTWVRLRSTKCQVTTEVSLVWTSGTISNTTQKLTVLMKYITTMDVGIPIYFEWGRSSESPPLINITIYLMLFNFLHWHWRLRQGKCAEIDVQRAE